MACAQERQETGFVHATLHRSSAAPALTDHEALDGVVGVATSEHFAYKWGAGWAPTVEEQGLVLDSLETAWASQVEALGFVPPPHSDEARFNVYAGASGLTMNGQPLAELGLAYLAFDPQGWPMMVLNPLAWEVDADNAAAGLAEPGETVLVTVTHELQHGCHFGAGAWSASQHLWLWEGRAHWTTYQVAPGNWLTADAVYGQALLPYLAWQWVDLSVITAGDPYAEQASKRIYGTWTLAKALAEELGEDLVVRWATDQQGYAAPLKLLEDMLEEEGLPLQATLAETWGRLRTGDFQGDRWLTTVWQDVTDNPQDYPDFDPLPEELVVDGSWLEPDLARLPQHLRASRWRLQAPPELLLLDFEGDTVGGEGTGVAWQVVALTEDCAGAWAWRRLDLEVQPVELDLAGAEVQELLVVPGADSYQEGEGFGFGLALTRLEPSGEGPASGSACTSATAPTAGWLVLLPLGLAWRRRGA